MSSNYKVNGAPTNAYIILISLYTFIYFTGLIIFITIFLLVLVSIPMNASEYFPLPHLDITSYGYYEDNFKLIFSY